MDVVEDRKVKAKGQAMWLYVYSDNLHLAVWVRVYARVRMCVYTLAHASIYQVDAALGLCHFCNCHHRTAFSCSVLRHC